MTTMDTVKTWALNPEKSWEQYTKELCEQASDSMEIAERFDVPKVNEAEAAFTQALAAVTDPDVRFALDSAAGRIAYAYQMLGFCAGSFAQSSAAATA